MSLRKIELTLGNGTIGWGVTWSYPRDDGNLYKIPIYSLKVEGEDDGGKQQTKTFEAFRFGVHRPTAGAVAQVVGLADEQTHTIKAWIEDYSVHSARSLEKGAWKVYSNFLIHDGPDDPKDVNEPYASIGCVEICKGPAGFDEFNNFIISLSGSKKSSRNEKLKEIGSSGKMAIKYLKASRPPLTIYHP